ncbi:MAG TPA: tRNA 4-thiouridine(8) synthase ThiI [Desulfobacterales bacterium]|nr:tRNA 4-thiouridine(8) synthase ThiI [Desulfobacterales bacterium]
MNQIPRKVRALGLCSGGLDSILSALVLKNQGIEVEWITFETPFFSSEKAEKASGMTGIPLTVKNITPSYLDMLKNPRCGYGKYMNPCMDCHALMFRIAGGIMETNGFDFLFSGEVLGQRPMSQTKPSLRYVEKHSGYAGYILRPLSSKLLPETIAEQKGLVKRDLLLGISGRGRKEQIKLAENYGITEYPAPAGGCLLTDKRYSDRLRDLFDHQDFYTEAELHLLKYGRHFRIETGTKIIIGRTRQDNKNIIKHCDLSTDTLIRVKKFPGPIALIPHGAADCHLNLAASICIGYSKAPNDRLSDVLFIAPKSREIKRMLGIPPSQVQNFLI